MIAYHNSAVGLADHIGHLQKNSFPDSKIAKNYQCARTKTVCILNHSQAPHLKDELVTTMKRKPFCLSVDVSNDTGHSNILLLLFVLTM